MSSFRTKVKQIHYLIYFVVRSFLITVFCFISLLCFAFLLYFGDLLISTSKGNPKNPLFGVYLIVSPSMVPTIKINDAIIIKRIDHDKYNIGDVITFSSSDASYSGKAVTHRIVNKKNASIDESIYTTKGDNNMQVDKALVKTEDIYGRVLFKIPAVGKMQALVSSPARFFLSLLIPAIILLIYELSRIVFMMSKRKA